MVGTTVSIERSDPAIADSSSPAEVADGLRRAGPPHAEEPVWTSAKDVLENFSDDEVRRALGELPDDQRLTLFLVDVEGLSQEEAAEITGVPAGTVKSRTSRARETLKQRLMDHAVDLGLLGRVQPSQPRLLRRSRLR